MSTLQNPSERSSRVIPDHAMKKQLQLTVVVRTLVRFRPLLSRGRPIQGKECYEIKIPHNLLDRQHH